MKTFDLDKVQSAIASEGLDGWLLYDFQGSDPIACRLLSIGHEAIMSRRWFYFIPKNGTPRKLMHKIEPNSLDHLPGEPFHYAGWKELDTRLAALLQGSKVIAMNYSPKNKIPYVSRVDAGTIEMVRATGVEVKTAADLIQQFEAVWTDSQLQTHIRAAKALRAIVDDTFQFVAQTVGRGKPLNEYEVQQHIVQGFEANGLTSYSPPIAAVGPNSGNPHYTPDEKTFLPIHENDFLLIDLWAKEKTEDAVYADITWTGYIGKKVPDKYEEIFQIVRGGRDSALKFVEESLRQKKDIAGWEVDEAARTYILAKGYGDYFIHRTGHNIGLNVHGNGANMDNFETREERKVLPKTCFSIEPGIYLKEFGVRSEIDVYVDRGEAMVYGQPLQTTVVPILG